MKYILASGSPRRKELLKFVIPEFEIITADIEEICPETIKTKQRPEYLALKKAKAIAEKYKDATVIGADTAVFLGENMLGKPKSVADAKNMLKSLSGKTHSVITGCAIVNGAKEKSFSVETKVKFLELDDNEIDDYIKTNEPFDKAGGYGIQGFGALLVESIMGDYFNVVGLPISKLNIYLKEF